MSEPDVSEPDISEPDVSEPDVPVVHTHSYTATVGQLHVPPKGIQNTNANVAIAIRQI